MQIQLQLFSVNEAFTTHRKKMISDSSLQKFYFQGPLCLNNYYLPKMHYVMDPFTVKEKNIHQIICAAKWQTFSAKHLFKLLPLARK